jgi:hypothetical protein
MNKRKQRRFSTSAVLYIPISVLLIIFLFIFGISVFLKIIDIEVTGASVYTAEEIRVASGIMFGDNLLFMDEKAMERSIRSDKPFVKDVKVTRVPPSTVHIKVTESTALATVDYQGQVLVIDSECRILRITDDTPDGLIEIRGFTPNAPAEGSVLKAEIEPSGDNRLAHFKNVLAAIKNVGIAKDISYLDISNISKTNFEYVGRIKVILGSIGSVSEVRDDLSALPGRVASITTARSPDVKGEIDLSDPDINRWSWREYF